MKNLKYIKLYEAFESEKLSKTLGYVKSGKSSFLDNVKKILSSIDFPYSKISDEYFEYLPFTKALKKADILTDEPCEATSEEAFPDYAVEGAKCESGKIKRKWGSRERSVECPVCGGTGVKPKNPGDLKLIKFWFTKEGNYITTTCVDGVIRSNVSVSETKRLSDNLSDYKIGKRVSKENVTSLESGTFILLQIEDRPVVSYIYRQGSDVFALQNHRDGGTPSGRDWRDIAYYSWKLGGIDHGGGKLIYPTDVKYKEPDPYTWNTNLIIGRYGINSGTKNIKDLIKEANFALVLDFSKLKNSEFETTDKMRSKRQEIKKGAFLKDEEIREQNIKRYIDKITKSMDIVADVSNVNKLLKRLLMFKFSLFVIANGTVKDILTSIITRYYQLLSTDDDDYKKDYIEKLSNYVESAVSTMKNSKLASNINYLYNRLKNEDRKKHILLLDEILEISEMIYEKVKSIDVETIEDLEVIHQKLLSILYIFNTSRYKISAIRNFLLTAYDSSETRTYDRYVDGYYGFDDEQVDKILSEIDRVKKVISKI